MRSRTSQRHDAILRAAVKVFLANGFDGASMEAIASHTPCSKVTLYGYFSSKESLFYEAVVHALDAQFLGLLNTLDGESSPARAVLLRFGEQLVATLCKPEVRALRRLVIATSSGQAGELQRKWFDDGPKASLKLLAAFFERAEQRGELVVPDPVIAGLQLRALLEAEWLDVLFYDLKTRPSKKQVTDSARRAIEAFMRLYGAPARPSTIAIKNLGGNKVDIERISASDVDL